MKSLSLLLASLVAASLTGCSPTRAYSGVVLPATQRSVARFYDLRGIELSSLSVDGVEQGFGLGIEVAPGTHEVTLDFVIRERDCSLNSSWCGTARFNGKCHATFVSKPGVDYKIELSGIKTKAWITVLEETGRRPAGSGSCSIGHAD